MGGKFSSAILLGILGVFILGILNIISDNINNQIFQLVVIFLNQNIWFILIIFGVIILGNIFETFLFPFNMIYPLIKGAGAVLWVGVDF